MAVDSELVRALASLCEQISGMRDDLYNTAVLQNGEVFAGAFPIVGERSFTTADMPPQSAQVLFEAFKNDANYPVAVHIRSEPHVSGEPPNPLMVENVVLLVSLERSEVSDARAAICKVSSGEGVTVLVKPAQSVYVSVMATGTVNVSWRVIPLRGRKTLGGDR